MVGLLNLLGIKNNHKQKYKSVFIKVSRSQLRRFTDKRKRLHKRQNRYNFKLIEYYICKYTNIERRKRNLRPVKIDKNIVKVSRYRVRDMIVRGYFSHYTRYDDNPNNITADMGYEFRMGFNWLMENIAKNPSFFSYVIKDSKKQFKYKTSERLIAKEFVRMWDEKSRTPK